MDHEWDSYAVGKAGEAVVALKDAKEFLGSPADDNSDDDIIQGLIDAAGATAEAVMRRTLIQQSRVLLLTRFPEEILLPMAPLISVTTIKYLDTDGVQQTLASTEYQVNTTSEPGRIKRAYDKDWPDIRCDQYNSVEITYLAGYGKNRGAIPADIMQAIKMVISTNYDIRENVVVGTIAAQIPGSAESVFMRNKIHRFDVK